MAKRCIFGSLKIIILFLVVVSQAIVLTNGGGEIGGGAAGIELVVRSCNDNNTHFEVTNKGGYVNYTMVEMETDMEHHMFAVKEEGDPPNKRYLYAQCMGDLTGRECRTCFYHIRDVMSGCYKGGRLLFDGCYMRSENFNFFQLPTSPHDLKKCSDSVDNRTEFSDKVRTAISELVRKTPENEGGYAVTSQISDDISVYAMANCWKTMSPDMCSECLLNASSILSSCLPSVEAFALNSGCLLRYSDYDFSNHLNAETAKESIILYVVCMVGGFIMIGGVSLIVFCVIRAVYKRKDGQHKSHGREMTTDLSILRRNMHLLQFKYSTLEKATNYFAESHKLGQGGYGEVFKGNLADGRELAIKRLFLNGKDRKKEVCNELDIISKAEHKNLVRFLGCCFTDHNSFLIYEFLANRSLDCILFDLEKKKELDWKKRLRIIIGTAQGLEYLHEECEEKIVHRDIKASNILLDLRCRPKIADFGLARFYSSSDKSLTSTTIAGTIGYMAPEYLAQGRLTEKVDVFSFGVLVLEIVSGVKNNKFKSESCFETLVTRAWNHFQSNTVTELIDQSIEIENTSEVVRVVQVGLLCTQESPWLRPSMAMVIKMIREKDFELPKPSRPPFTDEQMEIFSPSGPSIASDFSAPYQLFNDHIV